MVKSVVSSFVKVEQRETEHDTLVGFIFAHGY